MTSLSSDHGAARPAKAGTTSALISRICSGVNAMPNSGMLLRPDYGLNRGREIYRRFSIVDDGFVADIVASITDLEHHVQDTPGCSS
jgi:hypothetical protein